MSDGPSNFGHVPVLLERCVELLTPALTRHHADGSVQASPEAAQEQDAALTAL